MCLLWSAPPPIFCKYLPLSPHCDSLRETLFAFRTAFCAPDSICGRIVLVGCRGRGGGISRAPGYFPTTSSGLRHSPARQTRARRAGQSTGVHAMTRNRGAQPTSSAAAPGGVFRRGWAPRRITRPRVATLIPTRHGQPPFGRVHEAHKARPPDINTCAHHGVFSPHLFGAGVLVPLEDVESRPPWPRIRAPPAEPAHLIWTVRGVPKGLFFVTADRYWHAFTIVLHCSANATLASTSVPGIFSTDSHTRTPPDESAIARREPLATTVTAVPSRVLLRRFTTAGRSRPAPRGPR